ncbi:MAG: PD40 domain-containing protein [Myxococcales bacterium]|nr:PD40 domain-containing protein [Myxococcales bacterium]
MLLIAFAGCRQILGIEDPVALIPTDAPADTGNDGASDGAIDGLEPATCMMRWSTTPVFGAPVALATLNSGADEDHPFLSPDELTIYFTRGVDVYTAKRSSLAAAFGAPVTEPSLNGTATEGKVFVSADDSRAFFASNRAGGSGGYDLWRGARSGGGGGSFTVDQMYLTGVNDAGTQADPHLSTDLLRLYYATDISGARRIAVASRNNVTQNFSAADPSDRSDGGHRHRADPHAERAGAGVRLE